MPTIPRAADITRVAPDGQQAITRPDTSAAGVGLAVVGEALQGFEERKTNFQLNQAKSVFLQAKAKQDNAYANDEDYETIPSRYQDGVTAALDEAASLIANPRAREEFRQNAMIDVTQGLERIKGQAATIEREYQRAFISDSMEGATQAALTGDVTSARDAVFGLIDSSVAMNYMTPEEAQRAKSTWRDNTLTAKVEMMEPEDRIDALQQDWAQDIPVNIRTKLQRDAKTELDQNVAMANVDSYAGMDEAAVWSQIAQIEDEDVRRETERRYDNQLIRQNRTRVAATEDLYRAYFMPVMEGDLSYDDIPAEDRRKMSPTMLENIKQAEKRALQGTDVVTPPEVYERLWGLYRNGTGDPNAVLDYYMENSHRMSDTDRRRWSKLTADSFATVQADPLFTVSQSISARVQQIEPGTGRNASSRRASLAAEYERDMEQWYNAYTRASGGKEPSPQEVRDQIDSITLRVPTGTTWRGIPNDFEFWDELDVTEQEEVWQTLRRMDPDAANKAVVELQAEVGMRGSSTRELVARFMELSTVVDDAD